jgi:hypothetical protein
MPVRRLPIYYLPRAEPEAQVSRSSSAAKQALIILLTNPKPDTFLGRKTYDPFPAWNEVERKIMAGWASVNDQKNR